MKTAFLSFIILLPLYAAFPQSPDAAPSKLKQDSVVVNGEINISGEMPVSITFSVADHWLGIERRERGSVDEEGRFSVKFFIRNTQQVYWRYRERGPYPQALILSPGDTLTLNITDSGVRFSGRNAAVNEDHHDMRTSKERSAYYHALETGYRLEPEVYLQFRKGHYEKDLKDLEIYCKSRDCSELFKRWYAADAKVRYFRDLMAYSWKSVDYGLGSPVRLTGERKANYNAAYLDDIDLDDSTYTMSRWYHLLLNGYAQKVEKRIPPDEVEKVLYITKLNFLLDIISKELTLEVNESSANKRVLNNLLKKAHKDSEPDSADLKVMWKLAERYELPLQRAMDTWNTDRWVEEINSIAHQNTRELTFLHTFVRFLDQVPQPGLLLSANVSAHSEPRIQRDIDKGIRKEKGRRCPGRQSTGNNCDAQKI